MSGPTLTIRLGIECPPQVVLDCLNDGEEARLVDWLMRPGFFELVHQALVLRLQARAA